MIETLLGGLLGGAFRLAPEGCAEQVAELSGPLRKGPLARVSGVI